MAGDFFGRGMERQGEGRFWSLTQRVEIMPVLWDYLYMPIFDELKAVGKVLQEAGKIEQYKQILDALRKLLEMQKCIEELETDNKRLREELEIKGQLVSERNVYWIEKDGVRDGPFCTRCWDDEHKPIRLHKSEVSDRLHCPKCNTVAKSGTTYVSNPINHRRNSAM